MIPTEDRATDLTPGTAAAPVNPSERIDLLMCDVRSAPTGLSASEAQRRPLGSERAALPAWAHVAVEARPLAEPPARASAVARGNAVVRCRQLRGRDRRAASHSVERTVHIHAFCR
jgi:hypothetical protein